MKFRWNQLAGGVFLLASLAHADGPPPADTAALNKTAEVKDAFAAFYRLDYDTAERTFQRIAAERPNDPLATDFLLDVAVFRELTRLDALDTTFYANDGFLSGKHTVNEDPAARDRIRALQGKAQGQADALLKQNPHDIDALYARGWSRSLLASYTALVERAFPTALKLALSAKADQEAVLKQDPNYVDANLVVGTYQYVVGALPRSFRFLIGIAGITGSKEKGMAMLQLAAARGVRTSIDARTCMMLFLRREGRYAEAQALAEGLAKEYPRDYLFQLELANLKKDAGAGSGAIAQYQTVLADARRPGWFHNAHLELGYFGLGDTYRGQKMYGEAAAAYQQAAGIAETGPELKQRCLVSAGKAYDLMHDRARATESYQAALDVAGPDTVQGQEARKLMRKPFQGA